VVVIQINDPQVWDDYTEGFLATYDQSVNNHHEALIAGLNMAADRAYERGWESHADSVWYDE